MSDKLATRRPSLLEENSNISFDTSENQRRNHLNIPGSTSSFSLDAKRQSLWSKKSRRLSFLGSFSSRRSSQDPVAPRTRLQNTYKLEPDDNLKFIPFKFETKIYQIMENHLKEKIYANINPKLVSKEISDEIMRMAKTNLHNSRYKFISHVTIGQYLNYDLRVSSLCVWNTKFDNYVSSVFKNKDLYAVATLYAIYFE